MTRAALFHFLAAEKTRNKKFPKFAMYGTCAMIYMPEEASGAFLVNWFRVFSPKFSLLLFTDNFINRMVKTSKIFHIYVVTTVSCINST